MLTLVGHLWDLVLLDATLPELSARGERWALGALAVAFVVGFLLYQRFGSGQDRVEELSDAGLIFYLSVALFTVLVAFAVASHLQTSPRDFGTFGGGTKAKFKQSHSISQQF